MARSISKYFGVFPYNNRGKYDCIWSIASVCLLIGVLLVNIYSPLYLIYCKLTTDEDILWSWCALDTCRCMICSICLICQCLQMYRYRNDVEVLLSLDRPIDNRLIIISLGFISLTTTYKMGMRLLTLKSAIVLQCSSCTMANTLMEISMVLATYQTGLIIFQICYFCKLLSCIVESLDPLVNPTTQMFNVLDKLKIIKIYGFQLFCVIVLYFVEYVNALYSLLHFHYVEYVRIYGYIYIIYAVRFPVNFCNPIVILLTLIKCTTDIENCIEEHYNKLFKIVWKNDTLYRDKRICLYLREKKPVQFTAYGFTLAYPFITSMVAAATTYIVILLQISDN